MISLDRPSMQATRTRTSLILLRIFITLQNTWLCVYGMTEKLCDLQRKLCKLVGIHCLSKAVPLNILSKKVILYFTQFRTSCSFETFIPCKIIARVYVHVHVHGVDQKKTLRNILLQFWIADTIASRQVFRSWRCSLCPHSWPNPSEAKYVNLNIHRNKVTCIVFSTVEIKLQYLIAKLFSFPEDAPEFCCRHIYRNSQPPWISFQRR